MSRARSRPRPSRGRGENTATAVARGKHRDRGRVHKQCGSFPHKIHIWGDCRHVVLSYPIDDHCCHCPDHCWKCVIELLHVRGSCNILGSRWSFSLRDAEVSSIGGMRSSDVQSYCLDRLVSPWYQSYRNCFLCLV